jgi:hypothetical protein
MKVVFSCDKHLLGAIPSPVPAVRMTPDYFRQVKPQVDNHPKNGTVKRCVPFLDALSSGFIIPMWCDVYVLAVDGKISIDFPPNFPQVGTLGTHSEMQIPRHPLSHKPYGNIPMKWVNPWVVSTEPGVSCTFTSPMNHMETRFKLLDGVVDTDTYQNNVNFPFIWTGGDGQFFIPKGTPLVQVIPFRREEAHIEVSVVDQEVKDRVFTVISTKLKNAYRDEFWHGRKASPKEPDHSAKDVAIGTINGAEGEIFEPPSDDSRALPAPDDLHGKGYVVLNNLISKGEASSLTGILREYLENNDAKPDSLCPKSKAVHGLAQLDELLERLTPVVCEASGKNLVPTYSYARMYVNGEVLAKHRDRPACQYSVTLCLGMDAKPWPIFMAPLANNSSGTPFDAGGGETQYMGKPSSVELGVGDGVLYLGMDMVHYREPFEGEWQAQVFLHWVDADGDYASQKYDGREGLSHHKARDAHVEDLIGGSGSLEGGGILEVLAACAPDPQTDLG